MRRGRRSMGNSNTQLVGKAFRSGSKEFWGSFVNILPIDNDDRDGSTTRTTTTEVSIWQGGWEICSSGAGWLVVLLSPAEPLPSDTHFTRLLHLSHAGFFKIHQQQQQNIRSNSYRHKSNSGVKCGGGSTLVKSFSCSTGSQLNILSIFDKFSSLEINNNVDATHEPLLGVCVGGFNCSSLSEKSPSPRRLRKFTSQEHFGH